MSKNTSGLPAGYKQFVPSFLLLVSFIVVSAHLNRAFSQSPGPQIQYLISFPQPESHCYELELRISHINQDTIHLKLPNWMPGYYQMMYYAKDLENFMAKDENGNSLPVDRINEHTWSISDIRNNSFFVTYTIRTRRKFVANSYVDKDHAYLVPGNTFLYLDGYLQTPVRVKIKKDPDWEGIATGLESVKGNTGEFFAAEFDILYDCPILIGDLEELPSFNVRGIEHRFIGYKLGNFDRVLFMDNLKRAVQAAVDIIGDVPYKQYTFIAIGPGFGGIEHLNNTTVSFDGKRLNSPEGMSGMLSFLTHEYFHHYNVKRIRPFELGPFDYENESRTNLLWLCEGITVYYETQILKRAGLIDSETFFSQLNNELNTLENDSGRYYQSLSQASYNTWEEGPFGDHGSGPDKSISVYNKGAIIGMLLDLEVRSVTGNNKSLDDVLKELYRKYYIEEKRGFTDAEFQQVCEQVAGSSLKDLFEYVYTTKEIDYAKYLDLAGLKIEFQFKGSVEKIKSLKIIQEANPTLLQSALLSAWLGE